MEFSFENLYDFIDKTGITIPITTDVKESVENTFKRIFGADLDVSAETPVGRLVEAISLLFVNILGVNAQNANGFNVRTATGVYLDALGNLFGMQRADGEDDNKYRNRILSGQSRGTGYAQSIMNAISAVNPTSVYVLENGSAEPAILPDSETGILVDPHSVFVSVSGGDDDAIANAIYATKSAGCGYTDSTEYGTKVVRTVTDSKTGSVTDVVFYRPIARNITVDIRVKGDFFTGVDIVDATKSTILELFSKNGIGSVTTNLEVASAVSGNGTGTTVTGIFLTVDGFPADSVVVSPCQYAAITADDITVTVI